MRNEVIILKLRVSSIQGLKTNVLPNQWSQFLRYQTFMHKVLPQSLLILDLEKLQLRFIKDFIKPIALTESFFRVYLRRFLVNFLIYFFDFVFINDIILSYQNWCREPNFILWFLKVFFLIEHKFIAVFFRYDHGISRCLCLFLNFKLFQNTSLEL